MISSASYVENFTKIDNIRKNYKTEFQRQRKRGTSRKRKREWIEEAKNEERKALEFLRERERGGIKLNREILELKGGELRSARKSFEG